MHDSAKMRHNQQVWPTIVPLEEHDALYYLAVNIHFVLDLIIYHS